MLTMNCDVVEMGRKSENKTITMIMNTEYTYIASVCIASIAHVRTTIIM